MRLKARIIDKIRQLQGAPEKLARSFALGSFMGVTPLIGMQILISIILSWIFRLHKGAAIAGVINTNWTKGLYLYPLNYKIGAFLLGIMIPLDFDSVFSGNLFSALTENGPGLFFSLLLGGCITGGMLATFYYFTIRRLLSTQIKPIENEIR